MTEYNECECGKPTNGKLRCKDCGCFTCGHCITYRSEYDVILICRATNFKEANEGFLLAPIVTEFDNGHCTLYRRKNEK